MELKELLYYLKVECDGDSIPLHEGIDRELAKISNALGTYGGKGSLTITIPFAVREKKQLDEASSVLIKDIKLVTKIPKHPAKAILYLTEQKQFKTYQATSLFDGVSIGKYMASDINSRELKQTTIENITVN